VIDTVLPLEQATEAHRRMEANSNIGKIVLRVSAP
jgi:NADPH:quinone reductase-like Zn-dependent oxidoreductase